MSAATPSPPPQTGAGGPASAPLPPTRRAAVTLIAALPWALVLFQFLVVIPRYGQMYREYGLKVPAFTQFLLDVAAWVNGRLLLAGGLTLGLMAAGGWVSHVAQTGARSRTARIMFLLLAFLVPCGLFVLTWVGVLGTHRTLVEGLNK